MKWMETVRDRLAAAGFAITQGVEWEGRFFTMVAHRSRFELSKCGNSETFFIFAEFDYVTTRAVRDYSLSAFFYALKHRKFFLPCGLGNSVWCFPVACCSEIDQTTVREIGEETPPRHVAAAEMPVLYNSQSGELAYLKTTPVWGAAYYKSFRAEIEKMLRVNP